MQSSKCFIYFTGDKPQTARGAVIETRCQQRKKTNLRETKTRAGREVKNPGSNKHQITSRVTHFIFQMQSMGAGKGVREKLREHWEEAEATGWSNHMLSLPDGSYSVRDRTAFNSWFGRWWSNSFSSSNCFWRASNPHKTCLTRVQDSIIAFSPLGNQRGIVSGIQTNSSVHHFNSLIENTAVNRGS